MAVHERAARAPAHGPCHSREGGKEEEGREAAELAARTANGWRAAATPRPQSSADGPDALPSRTLTDPCKSPVYEHVSIPPPPLLPVPSPAPGRGKNAELADIAAATDAQRPKRVSRAPVPNLCCRPRGGADPPPRGREAPRRACRRRQPPADAAALPAGRPPPYRRAPPKEGPLGVPPPARSPPCRLAPPAGLAIEVESIKATERSKRRVVGWVTQRRGGETTTDGGRDGGGGS